MIMVINNILFINLSYLNIYVKRIEIIIINVNIVNVRLRCFGIEDLLLFWFWCVCLFFLKVLKLIFKLFKNIKKIKFNVDKIFRIEFFFIIFRNEFLIIIFIKIFVIIIGKKLIFNWLIIIGVKNVVKIIIIKDKNFIIFF